MMFGLIAMLFWIICFLDVFLLGFFISVVTSFFYMLFVTIAFKRCREDRLKFGVIVSFVVFALVIAFRNENCGSLNPVLFFPMMVVSLRFRLDYFVLQIVVPFFVSVFACYVAMHAYKDFGNEKIEGRDIKNDLELIKPKKLKFEM